MKYKLIIFGYNFFHKKSENFLLILSNYQIEIVGYIAANKVPINLPDKLYKRSHSENKLTHPKTLCEKFKIPFFEAQHNSKYAESIIKETKANIAIISGARILKNNIISLFPYGIINFHPGKIPEASGLDGLLWSIYKNIKPYITTHIIDANIDAGSIINEAEISIFQNDRLEDIQYRLSIAECEELKKLCEIYLSKNKQIISKAVEKYYGPNKPMNVEIQKEVLKKFSEWKLHFSETIDFYIHSSSEISYNTKIGKDTKIWHFSNILPNTEIGKNCSLGQNSVVGPNVTIGDGVKVQNNISIYEGVEIEDDVFLGPSIVFTNVINPRAFIVRRDEFKKTLLKKGCTIGANATIVCGNTIGEYALIGSGAVVNKDVKPYALMVGVPAKQIGWVSRAGNTLEFDENNIATDSFDSSKYKLDENNLIVLEEN